MRDTLPVYLWVLIITLSAAFGDTADPCAFVETIDVALGYECAVWQGPVGAAHGAMLGTIWPG